jgi:hypothetical protein
MRLSSACGLALLATAAVAAGAAANVEVTMTGSEYEVGTGGDTEPAPLL